MPLLNRRSSYGRLFYFFLETYTLVQYIVLPMKKVYLFKRLWVYSAEGLDEGRPRIVGDFPKPIFSLVRLMSCRLWAM